MQSRVLAILIAVVLALVATAAMVVYVKAADDRARRDQEPVLVYMATQTIPAGTSGEDAQNRKLIAQEPVPRKNVVPGAITAPTQLEQRYAAVDIVKGEQLLRERWVGAEDVAGRRLLQIPEDFQAVSLALDLTKQVAGFITPGDRVGLVFTFKKKQGTGEAVDRTQFLLQNIQVLAVGATALPNGSSQSSGGRVNQGGGSQDLTAVTLAIDRKDVERVVYAAETGSIYLTLLPPNAPDQDPTRGGIDGGNLFPPGQVG
jgi:pilus assembly protein CpaB